MKQRISICTNFGNCVLADHKKKIPVAGEDSSCPVCGSYLTEFHPSRSLPPKLIGMATLLLFMIGASIAGWQTWQPLPPASHCLLDQALVDKNQFKPSLPMMSVDALENYPIPRELQPWMKNITQITSPAFFMMRREVTVGEFKRYANTLSQVPWGNDWQQDRHGALLPDDYPVSSLPWQAAKDYADWLAKATGCPLTLPTYTQWVAAVVQYAKPEQAVTRQYQQAQLLRPIQHPQTPERVVDLLGNLREWSLDNRLGDQTCEGHYILGEDYKTWLQDIAGEPRCEMMALDTIGFRLVRLK